MQKIFERMRYFRFGFFVFVVIVSSCKLMRRDSSIPASTSLAAMFDSYSEARAVLYPVEATINGDNRYNDRLPVEFTNGHQDTLRHFYSAFLDSLAVFPRDNLNANDQISYDIFQREMKMNLEALGPANAWHSQYMPFDQFNGMPILIAQMGSGTGNQPFRSTADYHNWIKRAAAFGNWADSAIAYMRTGVMKGYVLPRCLVVKMIPQLDAMKTADPAQSLFYGPVTHMPASFTQPEKDSLTAQFRQLISETIVPAFSRLGDFLRTEYLPRSRQDIGIDGVPGGRAYYDFCVRQWTTTGEPAEEIYQTGLSEVTRIRGEMENTMAQTGFKGDLPEFLRYVKTDPKFRPFKTAAEVLGRFEEIHQRMLPKLQTEFTHTPKMRFEIRQTEAFRAASASAEYYSGTTDGTRPGIFYVPILDASKYLYPPMESLFLHEAIPGHHYQGSLQLEDSLMPKFRRYLWYGAFGEGWALYCESLGKELGLYTDPYSYMGALGTEMHRAVRLVVDVAMHTKKMSRDSAIAYMMKNEPLDEAGATAEIERYISWPGQALSYKVGAMKIRELRDRYEEELGAAFKVSAFHDAVISDGALPLDVLERKMDSWEMKQ